MEHLIVNMGERRWLWTEVIFLAGVLPIGTEDGPKDEAELIRQIQLATLEQKGIPLEKMHVIIQPVNERALNPQIPPNKRSDGVPNGIWAVLWIQWLPEVGNREKLRGKTLRNRLKTTEVNKNRHYLITLSQDVAVDARLLRARWGTSTENPPINENRYAMKAMFNR